jgi:pimeloyl-ACP methyl ester carboxylesterase
MNPQRVRLRDHFRLPEFLRDWGFATESRLQSDWTDVQGLRMHSRSSTRRAGPRFLLIHGLVISSLYMIPLAEHLSAEFETHAIDLPGYGRSEKPREPLDVPALADAVAGWTRAHGGTWNVIGNSFGCQISAELAVRHPDCVATLILVGPTIDPAAPTLLRQAFRLFRDMPREPMRLWLNHVVDYARAGPRFAIALMRAMMADHIEAKLPRIAAPTLIIRGERDPVAPRRWTSEMTTLLPRGSSVEIPNGSHGVHYAAPAEVADVISSFVHREMAEPRVSVTAS